MALPKLSMTNGIIKHQDITLNHHAAYAHFPPGPMVHRIFVFLNDSAGMPWVPRRSDDDSSELQETQKGKFLHSNGI